MAGLLKETWLTDIVENLYVGNEWMVQSQNHDSLIGNNVVHIPQAGAPSGVVKNDVAALPLTPATRTDSDLTYSIDNYRTNAVMLQKAYVEKAQFISYDKKTSIFKNEVENLKESIASETLFAWSINQTDLATSIVRTTGSNTAALPPSATGTRNKVTIDDFYEARIKLDNQRIPTQGRVCLMTHEMYKDLFSIPELVTLDSMPNQSLPTGVIAKLAGFNIMTIDNRFTYNATTGVKNAIGAAPVAATDSFFSLFWHPSTVAKAMGATEMFIDEDNPLYQAEFIASWLQFHGASKMRADFKGIISLIQDNV